MLGVRSETGAPLWRELLIQHGNVINPKLARKIKIKSKRNCEIFVYETFFLRS